MRPYVAVTDHGRDKFWHEIDHLPDATPPDAAREAVEPTGFPDGAEIVRYASRVAGGGSLGRPRYVAIAEWNGGRIFREPRRSCPQPGIGRTTTRRRIRIFLIWLAAVSVPLTRSCGCMRALGCRSGLSSGEWRLTHARSISVMMPTR